LSDRPPSRSRAQGLLEIHSRVPRARIRKDYLLSCVRDGARRTRSRIEQINFILVGDREMARLHRTYSQIKGTTDVLTFDLSEGNALEGDIYICLDQARRQAKLYRVPLYQEVARLAVHGVLHLAGYDDHSDEQRLYMRRLEDRALAAGELA
jgi:probable rRNA maturation factor